MTDLSELKLYATKGHPCSYLPDEEATTIFVDPAATMNGKLYSQLSDFGFRRSGPHVYRPRCASCSACVPIRIPVNSFVPNRRQKRCWKRNQDLHMSFCDSIDSDEHYQLYAEYITHRHADGDMFPPSRRQYSEFLTSEWGITRFIEYRKGQTLLAVSVADELKEGLSAIYAFFEPGEDKRSLGVYNILAQIDWATKNDLSYVYLGYWIRNCQKMRYKVEYQPFQLLIDQRWMTVSDFAPRSRQQIARR